MMKFVLQDGWSPLMVAGLNGHLVVAKALIKAGADVDQSDKVDICTLLLHVV